MVWHSLDFFPGMDFLGGREPAVGSFRVNEHCFIRKEHRCGKVFGASKSCFIACPTQDDLEPILELISEKLTKVGIEPIIAVKERAYGQDIFCTKICGKIIEARFCIVILDDTIKEHTNIPNPNVYYEYGLMTALRKHIIPLQKEGLDLAFNIQSYDTIKYNVKNIASELDRAIRDAVRLTEAKDREPSHEQVSDKTILRRMELSGFEAKDDKWFLSEAIEDTAFRGFGQHDKRFYVYIGKIDAEADLTTYLDDLGVVLYRTERKAAALAEALSQLRDDKKAHEKAVQTAKAKEKSSILVAENLNILLRSGSRIDEKIADIESKLSLMDHFYIVFVVNTELNIEEFLKSANVILPKEARYQIVCSKNGAISFEDMVVDFRAGRH
jgi:hypothetical protein